MKLILCLSLMLVASCSHHHKSKEHHHHEKEAANEGMFGKKCAQAVAQGNAHVEGKEEYQLQHGGKTYYFSSEEMKNKFAKDLENNVQKAEKNWQTGIR